MATSLTTRHYEAANSFGGSAINVARARCTAGRLGLTLVLANYQQDAPIVLGTSFVSATLWKLSVLILLLILTLNRMVSMLPEVTSSAGTKYSWQSDEPGAKKRSVAERTSYTKKQVFTAARRS